MKQVEFQEIEEAKKAALEVLLHNAHRPLWDFQGHPVGDSLNLIQGI